MIRVGVKLSLFQEETEHFDKEYTNINTAKMYTPTKP